MNRNGENRNELLVLARRTVLDFFEALAEQEAAFVLIGSQAIYLQTVEASQKVSTPVFTTDGDIGVNPVHLRDTPNLERVLREHAFRPVENAPVGSWCKLQKGAGGAVEVHIDLMVPESVGGGGRRGARLGVHGRSVARKAYGIEGILVEQKLQVIESLQPEEDPRAIKIAIAGPSTLVVAKTHKISERLAQGGNRVAPKDALDVYRLLIGTDKEELRDGFQKLLRAEETRDSAMTALEKCNSIYAQRAPKIMEMIGAAGEDSPRVAEEISETFRDFTSFVKEVLSEQAAAHATVEKVGDFERLFDQEARLALVEARFAEKLSAWNVLKIDDSQKASEARVGRGDAAQLFSELRDVEAELNKTQRSFAVAAKLSRVEAHGVSWATPAKSIEENNERRVETKTLLESADEVRGARVAEWDAYKSGRQALEISAARQGADGEGGSIYHGYRQSLENYRVAVAALRAVLKSGAEMMQKAEKFKKHDQGRGF